MSEVIVVNAQDKPQRWQIVEKILRTYEEGELSTRRAFELLEKLYVTGSVEQYWDWPDVWEELERPHGKV